MSEGQDANFNEIKMLSNENVTDNLEAETDEGVDENNENFVVPKLPPLMTELERDAF